MFFKISYKSETDIRRERKEDSRRWVFVKYYSCRSVDKILSPLFVKDLWQYLDKLTIMQKENVLFGSLFD